MSEFATNAIVGQVFGLRYFVAAVGLLALALAAAGLLALGRGRSSSNAYQYVVALQTMPQASQVALTLVLLRWCLVVSCVASRTDVGLLLPIALVAVSAIVGMRARSAGTIVRGVAAGVVQYVAWLVFLMLCGYVTTTLADPMLVAVIVALGVLLALFATACALSEVRALLEMPGLEAAADPDPEAFAEEAEGADDGEIDAGNDDVDDSDDDGSGDDDGNDAGDDGSDDGNGPDGPDAPDAPEPVVPASAKKEPEAPKPAPLHAEKPQRRLAAVPDTLPVIEPEPQPASEPAVTPQHAIAPEPVVRRAPKHMYDNGPTTVLPRITRVPRSSS